VDINAVIDETIALVAMEADSKQVTVHTTLHASIPRVHVDRIQIQQVLLNLIVNAMQAMSIPAILERRLAITSELDFTNGVVVGVHDSGPGIEIERPDELFEAFYTTKADGLGMGLAICRTIIESHGGRIWAGPNSPRGAVFRFALPIAGEEMGLQGESHSATTSINRGR
jgi:C4-dicarboxylate-specific signal transduction histidine kinase